MGTIINLVGNFMLNCKKYFLHFFLMVFLFSSFFTNGQTVTIDVSNTPAQLVDMLMGGSCSVRSNHNISSSQSVGYFQNNGSSFPISEGIVIRSGNALFSQGLYTGQNLSSQANINNDASLQAISNTSGQISNITDVAFLEFDFVPNAPLFGFNFLFASNEYGEFQCGFSDVFAFLLTNLTTGETINMAVIPGTTTPISVREIRNNNNNLSCNSVNENLFGTYNVNNPSASTINMRGHTVVMNASAQVNPMHQYRIRLVIGDYNDSDFDSAVFIESSSFNTSIDLGEDQNICGDEDITLDTGITDTINYSFEWRRNGATIAGENNPILITDQIGTYEVLVTTNNNCIVTDEVLINGLQVTTPEDVLVCDTGATTFFNLTQNDETRLGIDVTMYEVLYFDSLANANANIPIPTNQWSNYESAGSETIYIRIRNRNTNLLCSTDLSFDLILTNVQATVPNNFTICADVTSIDIPDRVASQILNGLSTTDYTLGYFITENDAISNMNAISDPANFPTPTSDTTIWARLTDNINSNCYDVVNFTIQIASLPLVDNLPDVTECSSFTLPALTNGNYFLEPNGQGTQLNFGNTITESDIIYIFNQNANGCINETSFSVSIIESFTIETEHCESFTIPSTSLGDFYTESNGPNGTGTLLTPGTEITTNQTIYFYSEFNGSLCIDRSFDIEIFPLPSVDVLDDVIICNSYTLPSLTNGGYFTGPNGSGTELMAGADLTSSQIIYIFNDDGRCSNESSFLLLVVNPTIFTDVTTCGSYTLPNPRFGGYFPEPGGNGTQIPTGTVINETTTIYYYIGTTDGPNCTDNLSFEVTILPLPMVTTVEDVTTCVTTPYQLPVIEFGNYFTETNGQGTQLNPGDIINTNQTIYIYNTNNTCSNEISFDVTIVPIPLVSNFTDITVCDPYTLPPLSDGNYYTEPNGQGTLLNAGDVISSTQVIYIYNQDPILMDACDNETQFTVSILGITVDQLEDVVRCDSYTLPTLTVGDYFTEPNGQGTPLFAGDAITSSQTVYIYAENGGRIFCFDNHSFNVTITNSPALQNFQNQESCSSYILQTLNIPGVDVTYYREPGGVNLIDPADYTLDQPGIYTIHARLSNTNNPGCFVDEVFSVTVYPLQELIIEEAIICVDSDTGATTQTATLESGLNPNIFTVNWYLNNTLVGTGPNYEASETGIYTVETIKLIPDVGNDCNYAPAEVEVRASSPKAEITFLTEPFDALTNIRVDFIDQGLGTYEYQLDNGSFQTSNIFLNIGFGEHIVTIRDTSNFCGNIQLPFTVISHPTFFTPNGDGINDTWNIPDLRNDPDAVIKIYDRFGRFIKQIKPSEVGWNGFSNNGSAAPSTSYWFKVEFMFEGTKKTYTSYFALERK
jgi:gliding motility-associated-like protein